MATEDRLTAMGGFDLGDTLVRVEHLREPRGAEQGRRPAADEHRLRLGRERRAHLEACRVEREHLLLPELELAAVDGLDLAGCLVSLDALACQPAIVGVGPGRSFGLALAARDTTARIGLIPAAVGGSPSSSPGR